MAVVKDGLSPEGRADGQTRQEKIAEIRRLIVWMNYSFKSESSRLVHVFLAEGSCTGAARAGGEPIPATPPGDGRYTMVEHLREAHLTRALFFLIPIASGVLPLTAATPGRPPITNIANFVVKTDNLDEARRFYSGVLGYDEVFRHKRTISGPAELSVFKVNDHQYIEVAPILQNPSDDKLIQIGFQTADARQLREYLAGKGVSLPSHVSKDSDGNYSFVLKDPEGHNIEFVSISRVPFNRSIAAKASRTGAFRTTCCMSACT